ncbi:MAG: NYN domain-containing protein [Polyangiaceae bacterium]
MDRAAIFVDAGYLFAAGARLLGAERVSRSELEVDLEQLGALLSKLCSEVSGLPLLRTYWYDAAPGAPTAQQQALAYLPNLKLRLGSLNQQGQQKGVDSLLIMDLINLARNRAMCDALLITGDEDIRVGVQQAQEFGVRVHLLGVAPARENQSGTLVQDADTLREISEQELRGFMRIGNGAASGTSTLGALAARLAREVDPEELRAVLQESLSGTLPAAVDRRLLVAGSSALGAQLGPEQKRQLRAAFLAACRDEGER